MRRGYKFVKEVFIDVLGEIHKTLDRKDWSFFFKKSELSVHECRVNCVRYLLTRSSSFSGYQVSPFTSDIISIYIVCKYVL